MRITGCVHTYLCGVLFVHKTSATYKPGTTVVSTLRTAVLQLPGMMYVPYLMHILLLSLLRDHDRRQTDRQTTSTLSSPGEVKPRWLGLAPITFWNESVVSGMDLANRSGARIAIQVLNRSKAGLIDRDGIGVRGSAQHATATVRRGTRPGALLVVSPILSTHTARRG